MKGRGGVGGKTFIALNKMPHNLLIYYRITFVVNYTYSYVSSFLKTCVFLYLAAKRRMFFSICMILWMSQNIGWGRSRRGISRTLRYSTHPNLYQIMVNTYFYGNSFNYCWKLSSWTILCLIEKKGRKLNTNHKKKKWDKQK